jgi:hypothetical protein
MDSLRFREQTHSIYPHGIRLLIRIYGVLGTSWKPNLLKSRSISSAVKDISTTP